MRKALHRLDLQYRGYILEYTTERWLVRNADTGLYILGYDKYPMGFSSIKSAKHLVDQTYIAAMKHTTL